MSQPFTFPTRRPFLGALALAAFSFFLMGVVEWLGVRWSGARVPFGVVQGVSFLANAIAHSVGANLLVSGALRARLYEAERERRQSEQAATRRSQIGSGQRAEKIRTYNFPENRVTDHRVHLTVHRLDKILEGELDERIPALRRLLSEGDDDERPLLLPEPLDGLDEVRGDVLDRLGELRQLAEELDRPFRRSLSLGDLLELGAHGLDPRQQLFGPRQRIVRAPVAPSRTSLPRIPFTSLPASSDA